MDYIFLGRTGMYPSSKDPSTFQHQKNGNNFINHHGKHNGKKSPISLVQVIYYVILIIFGYYVYFIYSSFVHKDANATVFGNEGENMNSIQLGKGGNGSINTNLMKQQKLTTLKTGNINMNRELNEPTEIESETFFVVFSTDCNSFQDWQSLVVFLTSIVVGHKGPIIRIASGCSPEKEQNLKELYHRLGPNFYIHVTPDYSYDKATGNKYVFYNKPHGLLHWLSSVSLKEEEKEKESENYKAPKPNLETDFVALIDPDFCFMRPITKKIRSKPYLVTSPVKDEDVFEEVTKGHPAAQFYGIGDKWIEFNLTYITQSTSSNAIEVKSNEAWKSYSLGPPYIAHATDLYNIGKKWTEFVPHVYEEHPHLLAEMYSYSVASAHLELPHLRMDSYMTSDIEGYGEAWPWIEKLEPTELCHPDLIHLHNGDGKDLNHNHDDINFESTQALYEEVPYFLHMCQHYRVNTLRDKNLPEAERYSEENIDHKKYLFWKRDVEHNVFNCLATDENHFHIPSPEEIEVHMAIAKYQDEQANGNKNKAVRYAKRNLFQYCQIHHHMNRAIHLYQQFMCE